MTNIASVRLAHPVNNSLQLKQEFYVNATPSTRLHKGLYVVGQLYDASVADESEHEPEVLYTAYAWFGSKRFKIVSFFNNMWPFMWVDIKLQRLSNGYVKGNGVLLCKNGMLKISILPPQFLGK